MSDNYINKWNANGQEYDIQDAGRGLPLGVATLDNEGRIPYEQLPESAVEFKGYWNASTNTPHLADGSGVKGDMYYVDVAGSQNLGSGAQYFNVGDRVLYDGSIWKNMNSTTVKSVNSVLPNAQGNVALPTKVISIDDTLTVTGAPAIAAGDTIKVLFTENIPGTDAATVMPISYNGTSYNVLVPKDGGLSSFVATELTIGSFRYIDAYKYVEFMLNDSNQFIIIGNPIVLSGKGYDVYADGKVGNEPVGTVRALSTKSIPYGWLEANGQAISRTKYAELFEEYSTQLYDTDLTHTLLSRYGVGDGSTTFNLPDYREVALVGVGTNGTVTIATHDEYTLGEFKDDQMQKITGSLYGQNAMYDGQGQSTCSAAGGAFYMGGGGVTRSNISRSGTSSMRDTLLDSSRVTRTSSINVTHGKQTGVTYLIKVL